VEVVFQTIKLQNLNPFVLIVIENLIMPTLFHAITPIATQNFVQENVWTITACYYIEVRPKKLLLC